MLLRSGFRWPLTLAIALGLAGVGTLRGQEMPKPGPAMAVEGQHVYPINLATALQLAHVRNLDIQVAIQRIEAADAELKLARSRWLPTLYIGGDYARQDGRAQDILGNVLPVSRGSR